jgi:hypothetical protein
VAKGRGSNHRRREVDEKGKGENNNRRRRENGGSQQNGINYHFIIIKTNFLYLKVIKIRRKKSSVYKQINIDKKGKRIAQ